MPARQSLAALSVLFKYNERSWWGRQLTTDKFQRVLHLVRIIWFRKHPDGVWHTRPQQGWVCRREYHFDA